MAKALTLEAIGELLDQKLDKKFSDMNEKFDNLKIELKSDMKILELQMQQAINRPSESTSFVEGLSTAAAIGATPSSFNPSYLR